jgi:hypothetical protein
MISVNLSFDAIGIPISMVPSVLEKDNFLHGCITHAVKMFGAYAIPSVSTLYVMSRSVQLMHFSTDS